MTPADEHLETILKELERISAEAENLAAGQNEARLCRKPAPEVWSAAECLEHLTTAAGSYFPYFEQALAKARQKGSGETFVYRPSWMGKWMIDSLGPEVKRKMKAPKIFHPDRRPSAGVLECFLENHRKIAEFVRRACGLDINVRLRSPVTPLIRYSLGDAFQLIVVHARRHLNQARRALQHPALPVGAGNGRDVKPHRAVRELQWFGTGFLIPFILILVLDLFAVKSPLSIRERLLRLEDICVFGWCFLVPLFIYFLVTVARLLFRKKPAP
jgi:hypothetical protein